jgi:hypothetical protein
MSDLKKGGSLAWVHEDSSFGDNTNREFGNGA